MVEQQRMTKLRIKTVELDKYHPCLPPNIVAAVTNGSLEVVVEIILKLVQHVLWVSHENCQDVLRAIHSNIGMLICRLLQDIAKNFDALRVVEDADNAQVSMLCHQVIPALH